MITYFECVSVFVGTQYAMHMGHIRLLSVACVVIPYFSTKSHKGQDFRNKNLLNIKYVL
jgi:hypothetical protein